jgi:DNA-binding NarL/FixJ family response regulator
MYSSIKIVIKIALITAGIIILFQVAGLLFIYKYFTFDYYLTAVAAFFLVAGYFLSKFNPKNKPADNSEPDSLAQLTTKEIYILQLIVEGKSNKDIASINYVEVSTIKTHINNIYAKLGLNNRKEAINRYKMKFTTAEQVNIHPLSTS